LRIRHGPVKNLHKSKTLKNFNRMWKKTKIYSQFSNQLAKGSCDFNPRPASFWKSQIPYSYHITSFGPKIMVPPTCPPSIVLSVYCRTSGLKLLLLQPYHVQEILGYPNHRWDLAAWYSTNAKLSLKWSK